MGFLFLLIDILTENHFLEALMPNESTYEMYHKEIEKH